MFGSHFGAARNDAVGWYLPRAFQTFDLNVFDRKAFSGLLLVNKLMMADVDLNSRWVRFITISMQV